MEALRGPVKGHADKSLQQVWGWMKHNPAVRPSNTQHTAGHGSKATDRVQPCGLHALTTEQHSSIQVNQSRITNICPTWRKGDVRYRGGALVGVRKGGYCQIIKTWKSPGSSFKASKLVKMWLMIRCSMEPQGFTCRPLNMGQTLRILPTVGQRHW